MKLFNREILWFVFIIVLQIKIEILEYKNKQFHRDVNRYFELNNRTHRSMIELIGKIREKK